MDWHKRIMDNINDISGDSISHSTNFFFGGGGGESDRDDKVARLTFPQEIVMTFNDNLISTSN